MQDEKSLDFLCSEAARKAVEQHLGHDPYRLALDKRLDHAAEISAQVALLDGFRKKLPSFHAARCLLTRRGAEQASDESVAASRSFSGDWCVDLTCGLGVDALALSRTFKRVTAIERDPELARIARTNFARLGADNIEVVEFTAEKYIEQLAAQTQTQTGQAPTEQNPPRPDLIFADPDRRGAKGEKLVLLEDCSPDIATLAPTLAQLAPLIAVKLSPLFDTAAAYTAFGPRTRTEVTSLNGECKEVLVVFGQAVEAPSVTVRAIGPAGTIAETFPAGEEPRPEGEQTFSGGHQPENPLPHPAELVYVTLPDAALRHARTTAQHFARHGIWSCPPHQAGFSQEIPHDILGRTLRILSVEPFSIKPYARQLKREGIKSLDLICRGYPLGAQQLAGKLGVRPGGAVTLLVTVLEGKSVAMRLDNM